MSLKYVLRNQISTQKLFDSNFFLSNTFIWWFSLKTKSLLAESRNRNFTPCKLEFNAKTYKLVNLYEEFVIVLKMFWNHWNVT